VFEVTPQEDYEEAPASLVERSSIADSKPRSTPAAAIYTLTGSARLNGLDPEFYLRHVLERIAPHYRIGELLPWNLPDLCALPTATHS
jgi:hypothetical protein